MPRIINRALPPIFIVLLLAGCGQDQKNPAGAGTKKDARRLEIVEQGRALYLGNGCAVCHGKEGLGNGLSAERYYPRPINLTDPAAYTLGSSVAVIEQTLKKGIQKENSAMPAYDHLTGSELYAIAVFLESIQVKNDGQLKKEQKQ